MKRVLSAVASILLLQSATSLRGEARMVEICYVPVGVDTYTAMTVDNIDDHCGRTGRVAATDKRYLQLRAMLQKAGKGEFDGQVVRVKVAEPGTEPLYIDNVGGIRFGQEQSKLNAAALADLTRLLEVITSPTAR